VKIHEARGAAPETTSSSQHTQQRAAAGRAMQRAEFVQSCSRAVFANCPLPIAVCCLQPYTHDREPIKLSSQKPNQQIWRKLIPERVSSPQRGACLVSVHRDTNTTRRQYLGKPHQPCSVVHRCSADWLISVALAPVHLSLSVANTSTIRTSHDRDTGCTSTHKQAGVVLLAQPQQQQQRAATGAAAARCLADTPRPATHNGAAGARSFPQRAQQAV